MVLGGCEGFLLYFNNCQDLGGAYVVAGISEKSFHILQYIY